MVLNVTLLLRGVAFAQEAGTASQSSDFLITQPASPSSSKVNYELAYPGLLPDSPLYFLKALRDMVVGFLINNPAQRAQFDLLTSDKRMRAGQMLVAKKEDGLAVTTISKSNNYFNEALNSLAKAKSSGKDISSIASSMKLSIQKHQEVMKNLKDELNKNYAQEYRYELQRMEKYQKNLSVYR